jgi:hypothetical protein
MRGILPTAIAALAIAGMAGGAAAASIPVKIADGSAWTFTVKHTRDRERGGKHDSLSMTTVKQVTWRAAKGGAGILDVKPVSVTMDAGLPENLVVAQDLEIPVSIAVDEALTPVGLVNVGEVRRAFDAMLKRVTADPKAAAQLKQMFPDLEDATLTAVTTQDFARVALAQGATLDLGQERTYDDQAPNPLGGPPIATKGSVQLESYDKKAGRAVILWRLTMDPASTQASLTATMNRMMSQLAPDKAEEARAMFAKMKIERNDACRYQIDIPTGLALEVDCTATVVAGAEGQLLHGSDHWLITQTLPKAL